MNGIAFHYEEYGSGPPLLLIAGLGCATWMWWRTIPGLRPHFHLIAFDNRGVGESDKPDEPYSMRMMADDAADLLRLLGIERADIVGISMGGYIAQELALVYPALVRRMVLGATGMSGAESTKEFRAAVEEVKDRPPEQFLRRVLSLVAAPGYWERHPEEFGRVLQARLKDLPPPFAYRRQAAAAYQHDTRGRAAGIQVPCLVLAGELDAVVPVECARQLAAAIPGARLHIFPEAGHYFFAERAEEFHRLVIQFLRESD